MATVRLDNGEEIKTVPGWAISGGTSAPSSSTQPSKGSKTGGKMVIDGKVVETVSFTPEKAQPAETDSPATKRKQPSNIKQSSLAKEAIRSVHSTAGAATGGVLGGLAGLVVNPLDTAQAVVRSTLAAPSIQAARRGEGPDWREKLLFPGDEGTADYAQYLSRNLLKTPEPRNTTEKVVQEVASGLGSVASGVGTGRVLEKGAQAAGKATSNLGKFLAEAPAAQAAGSAALPVTSSAASALGLGQASSTAVGLVSSLAFGGLAGRAFDAKALKTTQAEVTQVTDRLEKSIRQEKAVGEATKAGLKKTGKETAEGKPVLKVTAESKPSPKVPEKETPVEGIKVSETTTLVDTGRKTTTGRPIFSAKVTKTPDVPEIEQFSTKPQPSKAVQEATKIVEETTKGWKNPPKINIVDTLADLPDTVKAAAKKAGKGVKAFVDDVTGEVFAIAKAHSSPEALKATIYHEALGHTGLSNLFGKQRDAQLLKLYNESPFLRNKVDRWMEANPEAYPSVSDRRAKARAVDEVFASMSEQGGPQTLSKKFLDVAERQIRQFARRMGFKNVDYTEKEIRAILAKAHETVTEGTNVKPVKGKSSLRFSREGPLGMKSLSEDAFDTVSDISEFLEVVGAKASPKTPRTIEEIKQGSRKFRARDLAKSQNLEQKEIAERTEAVKTALASMGDEFNRLTSSVALGASPVKDQQRLFVLLNRALSMAEYARGNISESARVLRLAQEMSQSTKRMKQLFDEAVKKGSSDEEIMLIFSRGYQEMLRSGGKDAAMNFIIRSAPSFRHEISVFDKAQSIIFNAMLGHVKTWGLTGINVTSTTMNMLFEGAEIWTRAGYSAVFRPFDIDRTTFSEAASMTFGYLHALRNFRMYDQMFQALAHGADPTAPLTKFGVRPRSIKNPAASAIFELPSRVMSAEDAFFQNVQRMATLHRLAAREVMQKNPSLSFGTKAFNKKLAEVVKNPSQKMLDEAVDQGRRISFRDHDKISRVTKKLQSFYKPKYGLKEDAKTGEKYIGVVDSKPMRAGKLLLSTMLPFTSTLDRVLSQTLAKSPLRVFHKNFWRDMQAGGVKREAALARLGLAGAFTVYVMDRVDKEEVTGTPPINWQKALALEAGKPFEAVKSKDGKTYESYHGIDPLAGIVSTIANANRNLDMLEPGSNVFDGIEATSLALMSGMSNLSFANSLANVAEAASASVAITQGDEAKVRDVTRLAGNTVAAPFAHNLVKYINEKFFDSYQRDTRGTMGSMDRLIGRVEGTWPGLSSKLPKKHDVYGREMKNRLHNRPVEKDPAVIELHRIESMVPQVVVGPVGATVKEQKLNASQYQEYQKRAGGYLLDSFRERIKESDWEDKPLPLKIQEITKIRDKTRRQARDELFPASS